MDAKAITRRVQHTSDRTAAAHLSIVQDRVMAPADNVIIAAVKAHCAVEGLTTSGTLAVLDLAGGVGHPAIPLALELPHACITLIDLSLKMVEGARQRITAMGLSDRISAHWADAQDLWPWQAASFAVVTCQYGLFLMPDHCAALREAARVLRPGGLLAASVYGTGNQMPQLIKETMRRLRLRGPAPRNTATKLADVAKTTADFRAGCFVNVHATPYIHTQVWKRDKCVAFVCNFLKPALLETRVEGRWRVFQEAEKACKDAMRELGFLSDDGKHCIVHNHAYLYTAVKPHGRVAPAA